MLYCYIKKIIKYLFSKIKEIKDINYLKFITLFFKLYNFYFLKYFLNYSNNNFKNLFTPLLNLFFQ